jgi:hypothetical protein
MKNSVRQFKEFKKVENEIQLLTHPFSFDVVKASDNLQLELKSDNGVKEKLNSVKFSAFSDCYAIPNTAIQKTKDRRCH